MSEAFVKLSGYSTKELRSIKLDIERFLLGKLRNLDQPEQKTSEVIHFV